MFPKTLLAAAVAIAAAPFASAAPQAGQVHSIAIVDLMPSHAAAGTRLLAAYVAQLRQAPGVASVALIQLGSTVNHFIVDARFETDAAYQAVIESPGVLTFRRDVYPHLGSPWDERIGHDVPP